MWSIAGRHGLGQFSSQPRTGKLVGNVVNLVLDGNRWVHGWNEHYDDNWTNEKALSTSTVTTTERMLGANVHLVTSGVRATSKRADGIRATGREVGGTKQNSAVMITKDSSGGIIHSLR